jgi:hypothetical protein
MIYGELMVNYAALIKRAKRTGLAMNDEYWAEYTMGYVNVYKGNALIKRVKT